ncbi:CCA tRNA nucleotidyltransferase [Salinibacterium sp. NSLL150]|uniref:CCA tRNA nucleotidyltransferase n=1 Tax=unclassified Salinibacterium TaxID=2632331 RepID=UPI0018CCAC0E|nr:MULTISPECIES: CCA tRNA nucleotidyltransferase [unclassified Salinibacterium]MBH0097760.1 CCA tRNA nucleotidyltransferase [Salinibacterium sp. NSLL35]MBH0100515.1 CCA tRNA nucleotidyltransferase [Salinibacterium sp. NSLL150]MBH0103274.1 CCA tRNA nucleotidyltransferase [Salinibacterium sp. NSLL16]MBH0106035.1 CCA tRNA nucleotidyltransferase [Salinibacterium sp. NSLL17]
MESVAHAIESLGQLADSKPVATLSARFAAEGFELALVGGPVRDAFLGRKVTDLDFATNATPDDIMRMVKPISEAQWDIGRDFGTIAARIDGETVEITTYRADSYDGATRKPVVAFGDSLEKDLERRDFSVNAMALRLPERVLVDPWGGVEHLLSKTLTTPGSPEVSFGDDPLRMMRAARFTSQLGFTVSPATVDAMKQLAPRLDIVSVERVSDELTKLLKTDDPVPGIRLMVETGLADQVLPEVPALKLEVDEHAHHKDVYEHSLTVLRQAIDLEKSRPGIEGPDLILRLAALLHDIGKPSTRKIERGGVVTFHHHDVVGAKLATKRLRALRFDKETITSVARLIELHLRFFGYTEGAWTDSAVRRYVRDAGDQLERLHIITRADVTTRNVRKADRLSFAYDDLEDRIAAIAEAEGVAAVRPDLDGEQIMAILGLKPSRDVGEAYKFLLDLRLDEGPLGDEEAEERLRAWWAARQ